MLSAGELGSTPATLESALKNALTCCQLWGAMLLLDKADVFLEARSSNSLERNELVAIFLRQLEYYQGLLFLTTNRISTLDPAFKSRIDLILPYYDLDSSARKQVWKNFMNRIPPAEIQLSDNDFDKLAETEMNGRDIKNTIKTSLILAARDKPLRIDHIDVVLGIRNRVEKMEFGRVTNNKSGN
jgi:SpoVK/Ycf46/Vps4 family AAA+-type ATPase